MKYAQLLIGLLAGTALGGSVVAGTGLAPTAGGGTDPEAIKAIVRQVISEEPKLILDSVQKFQQDEVKKQQESNNAVLKDPAVREKIFNSPDAAFVGPKDAKKVVVEFFDYDCPACKMMFKSIDTVIQRDKDVKIIFHEYPIFGEISETNAKIGIAVWRLYPEKYYDFHSKMMGGEGRSGGDKKALGILKDLGMDVDKVKAEAAKPELAEVISAVHGLGEKMGIRGTPTLVVGDEIVPHALSPEDLEGRLAKSGGSDTGQAAEKPEKGAND